MKRSSFVVGTLGTSTCALLPSVSDSAGRDVVVLLTSNLSDQEEACTDYIVEALRARDVLVRDPSSVQLTYHERAEVAGLALGPLFAIASDSVSWVEATYHSSRALFVDVLFHDSELPYGEFTVHSLRVTCAFRCMDIASREILTAGKVEETSRGEDLGAIESRTSTIALLAAARKIAPAIVNKV